LLLLKSEDVGNVAVTFDLEKARTWQLEDQVVGDLHPTLKIRRALCVAYVNDRTEKRCQRRHLTPNEAQSACSPIRQGAYDYAAVGDFRNFVRAVCSGVKPPVFMKNCWAKSVPQGNSLPASWV
jgi:hypothetical protein